LNSPDLKLPSARDLAEATPAANGALRLGFCNPNVGERVAEGRVRRRARANVMAKVIPLKAKRQSA